MFVPRQAIAIHKFDKPWPVQFALVIFSMVMGLEIDGHFKAYPFPELAGGPSAFVDEFRGVELEIRYDERNQTAAVYRRDRREIPTVLAFWFAWYAFHPDTEVWTR